MSAEEKSALETALRYLLRCARSWGLQCSANEAIRQVIGLGGGFTMSGGKYWHCSYSQKCIAFDARGAEKQLKFTPAMYADLAEIMWRDMKPAEPGTQLKLF